LNDSCSIQERSPLGIHCYSGDRLHVSIATDETRAYAGRSGIEPAIVGDLRQLLDREIAKLLALSNDPLAIGISHPIHTHLPRSDPSRSQQRQRRAPPR